MAHHAMGVVPVSELAVVMLLDKLVTIVTGNVIPPCLILHKVNARSRITSIAIGD
jgi:hypothetical protein